MRPQRSTSQKTLRSMKAESCVFAAIGGDGAKKRVLARPDTAVIVDLRKILRPRLGGNLASLFHAADGNAQVVVVCQRLLDEVLESLVLETPATTGGRQRRLILRIVGALRKFSGVLTHGRIKFGPTAQPETRKAPMTRREMCLAKFFIVNALPRHPGTPIHPAGVSHALRGHASISPQHNR